MLRALLKHSHHCSPVHHTRSSSRSEVMPVAYNTLKSLFSDDESDYFLCEEVQARKRVVVRMFNKYLSRSEAAKLYRNAQRCVTLFDAEAMYDGSPHSNFWKYIHTYRRAALEPSSQGTIMFLVFEDFSWRGITGTQYVAQSNHGIGSSNGSSSSSSNTGSTGSNSNTGGSISNSSTGGGSNAATAVVCRNIATAIRFFHDKKIAHGNLSWANLRVNVETSDIELGDVKRLSSTLLRTSAPETIKDGTVDFPSDVFSLGVMLYELAMRSNAEIGKNMVEYGEGVVLLGVKKCLESVSTIPKKLASLILSMLSLDPRKRPTIASVQLQLGEMLKPTLFTLLGTLESGKTTLFKHVHLLQKSAAELEETLETQRDNIFSNIVLSVKKMLAAKRHTEFSFTTPQSLRALEELGKVSNDSHIIISRPFSAELAGHIRVLMEEPEFRYLVEQSHMDISDGVLQLLQQMEQVAVPNYTPTITHTLLSRVKSTGIISSDELTFNWDTIRITDVGGARNERKKWYNLLKTPDHNTFLFMVNVNEYDKRCYEDNASNRMQESLKLFEEISNSCTLENKKIFLIFSNITQFSEKILRTSLKSVFPDYNDRLSPIQALRFLRRKFLGVSRMDRTQIMTFFVDLINREALTQMLHLIMQHCHENTMDHLNDSLFFPPLDATKPNLMSTGSAFTNVRFNFVN